MIKSERSVQKWKLQFCFLKGLKRLMQSAGVSAGIDMALQLVAWMGGEDLAEKIQLSLEYKAAERIK